MGKNSGHKSQNIFLQILVTFEINNLATGIRDRGWDKVAPRPPLWLS